jgi:hypothetical protein
VLTLAWQTGAFCSYHRSPYHSRPLRAASRHPGRSKENNNACFIVRDSTG